MYKVDLLYEYLMDETLCLYNQCLYIRMGGSGVCVPQAAVLWFPAPQRTFLGVYKGCYGMILGLFWVSSVIEAIVTFF